MCHDNAENSDLFTYWVIIGTGLHIKWVRFASCQSIMHELDDSMACYIIYTKESCKPSVVCGRGVQ